MGDPTVGLQLSLDQLLGGGAKRVPANFKAINTTEEMSGSCTYVK